MHILDAVDRHRARVRDLQRELGIAQDFFDRLLAEDDWSFIVKTHAVIEAAISQLLTEVVGRKELQDVFAKMPVREKLAFARAAGALDSADRKFIERLSELRNTCVHDVRMVGFSLLSHFEELDREKLKAWASSLRVDPRQDLRLRPKGFIWYRALTTLARIARLKDVEADLRRDASDAAAFVRTLTDVDHGELEPRG
jgi:hypothetical protein